MSSWNKAWDHILDIRDIFHNEDMSFEDQRDEIVKRIKESDFYSENDWVLVDIVGWLSDDNEEDFNSDWNNFYDWCDKNKNVWVKTF